MDASASDDDQAIDDFGRRSATLILWTGIFGLLVVAAFSYLNWNHLTTASVLWTVAAVSAVPLPAAVALASSSKTTRSIGLAIAWLGWFALVIVGVLVVVAWVAMCPADATLCGQGTIRR